MGRIADFLDQYQTGTRHSYSTGVYAFLSYINNYERTGGQRISQDDRIRFETFAEVYFTDARNYERDLIAFSNYCADRYAPTSCRHYLAIVKEFLSHNNVEFTRKQEKNIRNKMVEGGPVSEEAELNKELVRNILAFCDIRLKALILVLLSSGMRIGEAVQVRKADIQISQDGTHGIVTLKGVSRSRGSRLKNRHSRTTFIGKEAVEVVQQWYEVREKYLDTSCKRSRGRWQASDLDDGRVFPYGIPTLGGSLRTALKRANLFVQDEDTGRSTVHFHLFRKYFITTMTNSGIPEKFVDFYAGHLGELDRSYQKQTKDKLLEVYMRGEPYLRVYDDRAEEIAKTKEEIKETKERVRDMQLDNLTTRAKFEDLEREKNREIAMLKDQIQNIQDTIAHEKRLRDGVEGDPMFVAMKRAAEEAAVREYMKNQKTK